MEFRDIAFRNRLLAAGMIGFFVISVPSAQAANPCKSAISEEASAALLRMGQTLRAEQFSFQARTISVNAEAGSLPLHIFRTIRVTVRRPNRLLAEVTGDDGSHKLVFDGKTAVVFSARDKKYAGICVPAGTSIDGMLQQVAGRYRIDFPLADFVSEAPHKEFLSAVAPAKWSTL